VRIILVSLAALAHGGCAGVADSKLASSQETANNAATRRCLTAQSILWAMQHSEARLYPEAIRNAEVDVLAICKSPREALDQGLLL